MDALRFTFVIMIHIKEIFGLNKLRKHSDSSISKLWSHCVCNDPYCTDAEYIPLITSIHNLPINITSIYMFLMYNCAD